MLKCWVSEICPELTVFLQTNPWWISVKYLRYCRTYQTVDSSAHTIGSAAAGGQSASCVVFEVMFFHQEWREIEKKENGNAPKFILNL